MAAEQKPQSFGHYLLNGGLPDDLQVDGVVDKKAFMKVLSKAGRRGPQQYADIVNHMKKVGDTAATFEGLSVGLDDITPMYEQRDAIMEPAFKKMKGTGTDKQKSKDLLELQNKLIDMALSSPSDMALMAKSGGRGNSAQLMRTVVSATAAQDASGNLIPWMIRRSYSEGLRPDEWWVANDEARRNAISTKESVSEPGAFGKIMVANMSGIVVTSPDCGTTNGILMSVDDPHIADRVLSKDVGGFERDSVVTDDVIKNLKRQKIEKAMVRTPTTCLLKEGLCQRCYGLDEKGQFPSIGTNMGVRAAQALSEPLTQFALNAKHGVRLADDGSVELRGLKGVQNFLEFPKSFSNRAAVSKLSGRIDEVVAAPHGGTNIRITPDKGKPYTQYVGPNIAVTAKAGSRVFAGDQLTGGTALPDDVIPYKGIGAARAHAAEQVHLIFKREGRDLDKRHAELLARGHMAYARVLKDPDGHYIDGEIVPYNTLQERFGEKQTSMPLSESRGKILAEGVERYSAGTPVTEPIQAHLKEMGVRSVPIYLGEMRIRPIAKPLTRNPLLDPKWMTKMQHRYLKQTLTEGAAMGSSDTIHGTEPIPAYIFGAEFGEGSDGKY